MCSSCRTRSRLQSFPVVTVRGLFHQPPSVRSTGLVVGRSGFSVLVAITTTSDTIVGPVTMRGIDHQGTLGAWVGETTLRGNRGTMKNFRYADGADYMFPEDEVRAARRSS